MTDRYESDEAFIEAIDALAPHIGTERIVEDDISPVTVRRIAGMLDHDLDAFPEGADLPPHWFGMFFADATRQSDIGPDGHPNKGVVLPPIPLPRRMGAGRRVRVSGTLRSGVPARRITEVVTLAPKIGRTGRIAILTLRNTIETKGRTVAVDEFDAIYREMPAPREKSRITPPTPAPDNAAWSVDMTFSPTVVFRYSAITWNAHRIHYDADYARGEEGYPATVQNGGLTMTVMLEAALPHLSAPLAGFSARLTRPIYVGDTVSIQGSAVEVGAASCWVADKDGAMCATMDLALQGEGAG